MAGAVLPEAARGEPDDVWVYRYLDDGMARAVVLPAGTGAEHADQGLIPGAGGELAQAPPLARDPGTGPQGLVDGAGGIADRGLDLVPRVVVQLGEMASLRADGDRSRIRSAIDGDYGGSKVSTVSWPPWMLRTGEPSWPTWRAALLYAPALRPARGACAPLKP